MTKQVTNINGERLTRSGRIDQRHGTLKPRANDGFATHAYDVLHKPDDHLPWHVWETCFSNGARQRISRHSQEKHAIRRAEIERLKQPNRNSTPKMRHKLGIDKPTD